MNISRRQRERYVQVLVNAARAALAQAIDSSSRARTATRVSSPSVKRA